MSNLTQRIVQLPKENKAPRVISAAQIQKSNQRSILNTTDRRSNPTARRTSAIHLNGASIGLSTATAVAPAPPAPSAPNAPNADEISAEIQKRLSMVDVSGMLLEFYKTNVAKAPKTHQPQMQLKYRQTSPTSAETYEPSTIAAIATNGAAEAAKASKNLQGGEVPAMASSSCNVSGSSSSISSEAISGNNMKSMAFHPRIKYSIKNSSTASGDDNVDSSKRFCPEIIARNERAQHIEPTIMTAIPTSVVVPTSPQIDVKPIIHPTTGLVMEPTASGAMTASVIRPVPTANTKTVPSATAIAAALLQQQLRAQELRRQNSMTNAEGTVSTKILEKLLRQQHGSNQQNTSHINEDKIDYDDDDDDNDQEDTCDEDYDERYNGFDDIHLTEDSKQSNYGVSTSMPNIFQASMASGSGHDNTNSAAGEYFSTQSQKLLLAQAQAQAMRNLEFQFSDFSGNDSKAGILGSNRTTSPHNGSDASGEAVYECRHCGKKYRWKSTLRRHENVECGGKEPSHQCPYCPYKSKQRGNLGVHVRKHHTDLPQLASKRRSKYSQNIGGGSGGGGGASERASSGSFSANVSDDSSSKLVIDFSK